MPNAKIQFTVRMEDIPKEVRSRVSNLLSIYESSNFTLREIVELAAKDSPITMASKIDSMRQDIAFIDAVLQDCYNVLVGYSQYKSAELKQPSPVQEPAQNE